MSHFETQAPTLMIDWGDFSGSPVWPQTETLPWDNGNFDEAPSIVATPSRTGTGALKCVMGATSPASIRIRSSNEYPSFDVNIEDTTIGLWVYVDLAGAATASETIQIYLPNTATTNGNTANSDAVFFNDNYITKGWEYGVRQGWNYLKFSTADADYGTNNDPTSGNKPVPHYITKTFGTGGTPTTNLKSMQISFANFAQGDIAYLDRLEVGHKSETIIMFGWDANSADLIDIAKAKLDEYGYEAYFVVTENNTNEAAELTRGDTLIAAGWEAVNHTRNHTNLVTASQDDETFQAEIGWSFDRIDELGWTPPDSIQNFAYPDNAASWEAKERIARLYPRIKLARGVRGRWTHFHSACGSDLVPDPFEVGTFNMGNQHTENQLKATVDYAILLGTSLFIYGHTFEEGTPPNDPDTAPVDNLDVFTDHFENLVDYIATKEAAGDLRVMTPTQAEEIAEFGEFGGIRGAIIDSLVGDLSTATSFNAVRSRIPHSAVSRNSDIEVCIDLSAVQGALRIRENETLTFGPVLSAWTQEAAGDITVSGDVLIRVAGGGRSRRERAPFRKYPRRIMVEGVVYTVRSPAEERALLQRLARSVAAEAAAAGIVPPTSAAVPQRLRKIVSRLDNRIERTDDLEAQWLDYLRREDEEIIELVSMMFH